VRFGRALLGPVVGAGALALVLVGGCAPTGLNERLAIGTRPTASFVDDETGTGPTGTLTMRSETPRPREAWSTLVDIAPVDGIVHDPTFRSRRPISRRSEGRRVGAYPDPLGEPTGACCDTLWAALGELGRASVDAVVMQVRSISGLTAGRSGSAAWSPMEIWKRTATDEARVGTVPATRD